MSGIAKPLVNFSGSLTPTITVNVDGANSIEKIDTPAFNGVPAKYGILITYIYPYTMPRKIYFPTTSARNTSFASLETLLCATVA